MISVVVPVMNGGVDFRRSLRAIDTQDVAEDVEVIVVDSGSTDGSADVARRLGARVLEIPREAFAHGAARNLGAAAAKGDVLVFVSQDTLAASERWLATLVGPLRADADLAGVYGRQLPREDAVPPERYFLSFLYGERPRRQSASGVEHVSLETTLFSNVNSAIPRPIWERFRFAPDIVMSEDQEWSRRVLLAGYAILYEPRAAVIHSHRYTLASAFRRFFDSGVSAERAYLPPEGRPAMRRAMLRYGVGEVRWLVEQGEATWLPYALAYEGAKLAGLKLGAHHRLLPRRLKRRLSALPAHWF